jgi:hypothetical protein
MSGIVFHENVPLDIRSEMYTFLSDHVCTTTVSGIAVQVYPGGIMDTRGQLLRGSLYRVRVTYTAEVVYPPNTGLIVQQEQRGEFILHTLNLYMVPYKKKRSK